MNAGSEAHNSSRHHPPSLVLAPGALPQPVRHGRDRLELNKTGVLRLELVVTKPDDSSFHPTTVWVDAQVFGVRARLPTAAPDG